MFRQLTIGTKSFPTNIIQGPLAGISSAAFRKLIWQYSSPAFSYSEMISASALVRKHSLTYKRFLNRHPDEGPVCFQLVGNNSKELAQAVMILSDFGADLIDFNCGCSVPKVRGNGAGSSLLMDRPNLYKLLLTLRYHTSLPLLVKIRIAHDDKINQEIAQVIADSGIDCLVVHGRNWQESYATPCHYEKISFFVQQLKIPVIGNGDVKCIDSLKKMVATGCDGIMIARASVGQPWLIRKLIAQMNNQPIVTPSKVEIGQIYIEHVKLLAELTTDEKRAVIQARKLAKAYARCLRKDQEFLQAINSCDNLTLFKELCSKYFN
jgi:tRNA-dihydrouridine synthase B